MNQNPLDVFRTRMKETRERKGITLKEIAERVGCKEATIQRYESGNGIKSVPYDKIISISEVLGVTPQYLMGWEKPKPSDAEFFADIIGDRNLVNYLKKLQNMSSEDRAKVYSYIDFVISSKKETGD